VVSIQPRPQPPQDPDFPEKLAERRHTSITEKHMKVDVRISHLLSLQAGIGLLVAVALVSLSFWAVRMNHRAADQIYTAKDVVADILPPPMYLIEMRLVLSQALDGSLPHDRVPTEVKRLTDEYQARVQHWKTHPPHGLEAQLMGQQHSAGLRFIQQAEAFATQLPTADPDTLRTLVTQAHASYLEHRRGVDETVRAATVFSEASLEQSRQTDRRVFQAEVGLLTLAVSLLLAVGWWVRRRIVHPIQAAVRVADRIAAGDLTQPVAIRSTGETGQLLRALTAMQQALTGLVGEVRQATEHIQVTASEVAAGNQDLSIRTEQAASNLEETAASMEEINATVSNSAAAARQASELVNSASGIAARGGEMMASAVSTMDTISQRSRQIHDIIGVIDGIAFQTNILALNAAVEAARAGEQGRGFAVVAGEVRNLAQRSAQAAKEIKTLIGTSVDSVDTGSRQVADVGRTMNEIVTSVQKVTGMISEITAAAGEQSNGIAQVNTAVSHLDQMTQQNSALVEQSAAAAESLRQQAGRLADTVSRFKTA
jgi:methyl-accepting chemotaxis protein